MRRMLTLLAAAAMVALLAIPAVGQPYGPPPPGGPVDLPTPTPAEGQVITTTPCSTIYVTGDNWGDAEVFIDREFGGDNCPGDEDDSDDVQAQVGSGGDDRTSGVSGDRGGAGAAPAPGQSTVTTRDGQTVISVNEDGTFAAALTVPADVEPGELAFTVQGVDRSGEPKQQQYALSITPAVNFSAGVEEVATSQTSMTLAIVALLGAVILAVGFNWPAIARRFGRD